MADILVRKVAEPGWGKTTWVDTIELNLGGNGANTSYTLGKLGNPVRLLSAVGDDDFGGDVLSRLRLAGVDVSGVQRDPNLPTPTSVVLVHPDGARALLHRPGASRAAFPNGIDLTDELARDCSHLHLANIFGLPRFQAHAPALLASAKARGLRTSMDTAWDPQGLWMKTLGPALPATDVLFVNEDEGRELTGAGDPGRAADVLLAHGAGIVVVKLGPEGCLVAGPGERFHVPGYKVDTVDTTGAGDCFAGGFVAALQRGFDLRNAARFANAVGALSVASVGAVTGIGSFEHTLAFLDDVKR